MSPDDSRLVYASGQGRICPNCQRPVKQCACRKAAPPPPQGDGIVRIGRETKGRGGKGVTLIRGLALDAAGLKALAQQLKKLCGTGGTVCDGVIEIQGDQRERLLKELERRGFQVKLAGG